VSYDPQSVEVSTKGETFTVQAANSITRDRGHLRISKTLSGTPSGYEPTFDVNYVCTYEGADDITGSATVAAGDSVVVSEEGIPTGYECTVTEGALPALPLNYGWSTPSYSNNQETLPGNVVTIVEDLAAVQDEQEPVDQMATVIVANSATFTPPAGGSGALSITKTLSGGPEGYGPAFQIGYVCSDAAGSLSGTVSVFPGSTVTVTGIPNGYSCSVTEGDLSGAPEGYEWAAPQISGSPTSAIANNATVSVSVANSLTGGATDVNVPLPGTVEPGTPVDPDGPVTVSVPEQATLPNSVPAGGGFFALTRGVPGWLLLLLTVSTVAGMGGMLRRRWTNPS